MREREVVVLGEACLRDCVKPVGIRETHRALLVDVAVIVATHGVVFVSACCRIVGADWHAASSRQRKAVVLSIDSRVDAVVESCLNHCCCIALGVEELHHCLVGVELSCEACIEIDLHLAVALLTLFGGDDDDTVGSAATID